MSLAASHQQLLQTRLAAGLCKQHSQAPRRVHCKALASSLASLQTPVLQTAEQPDAAGPAAAECSRSPQDSTQEVQALPFSVVSFYRLVDLHAPQEELEEHRAFLSGRDIKGRIYLSTQGINAQFSGPRQDALDYAHWVASRTPFQGVRWNCEAVAEHAFPRLRLQHRQHLVKLPAHVASLPITDPAARATPLSPEQWRAMLPPAATSMTQQAPDASSSEVQADDAEPLRGSQRDAAGSADQNQLDEPRCSSQRDAAGATDQNQLEKPACSSAEPAQRRTVVVDVRNGYEWDAGHFQGAERPLEDCFNETPFEQAEHAVPAALQGADPANIDVMIYCTGGIRCDVYSTHLKSVGFQRLFTLEGGVQRYLAQQGPKGWEGSLFVFDGRMAIQPDGRQGLGAPAAAGCLFCGGRAQLPHYNCANIDCNDLFLSCPTCREQHQGCCSQQCAQHAPRYLRPMTQGVFGRWTDLLGGPDCAHLTPEAERMRPGHPGRKTRQQTRRSDKLAAQRDQQLAARAERHALAEAFREADVRDTLTSC